MIRTSLKLLFFLTACNLIGADICAGSPTQDKLSQPFFKKHSSLLAVLGFLGCGILYKLITKESAAERAARKEWDREQRTKFAREKEPRFGTSRWWNNYYREQEERMQREREERNRQSEERRRQREEEWQRQNEEFDRWYRDFLRQEEERRQQRARENRAREERQREERRRREEENKRWWDNLNRGSEEGRRQRDEQHRKADEDFWSRFYNASSGAAHAVPPLPAHLTPDLQQLYRDAGIPEAQTPFQVLELQNNASEAEIETRFKQLARQWHPDKHSKGTEAEQQQATNRFKLYQACRERCLAIRRGEA